MVLATTDKSAKHRGISAFLVDMDSEGFDLGTKEDKQVTVIQSHSIPSYSSAIMQ